MNAHPAHPDLFALRRHLEGTLELSAQAEIDAHLLACDACAEAQRRIAVLPFGLADVPSVVEPPVDLWPGISARIAAETMELPMEEPGRDRTGGRVRAGTRWAVGIAAAVLLGIALGRLGTSPLTGPSGLDPEAVALLATYESADYDQAVAELRAILDEGRSALRPETVVALESNLAIIDNAIEDARAALVADPANDFLHRHLANSMQAKLRLLRTVTSLVTADI